MIDHFATFVVPGREMDFDTIRSLSDELLARLFTAGLTVEPVGHDPTEKMSVFSVTASGTEILVGLSPAVKKHACRLQLHTQLSYPALLPWKRKAELAVMADVETLAERGLLEAGATDLVWDQR